MVSFAIFVTESGRLAWSLTATAGINVSNGVITWRPPVTSSGTTNPFTVIVADNGSPSLMATQSFNVVVNLLAPPNVSQLSVSGGQVNFTVNGANGPDYAILTSTNLVNWTTVYSTNAPDVPFDWSEPASPTNAMRFYRVKVGPPLP